MPVRPSWHEDYWKKLDKKTAVKLRTTCPRCGSANTYFNKQYKVWRCGKCEHSFTVEGIGDKVPFGKCMFRRGA